MCNLKAFSSTEKATGKMEFLKDDPGIWHHSHHFETSASIPTNMLTKYFSKILSVCCKS